MVSPRRVTGRHPVVRSTRMILGAALVDLGRGDDGVNELRAAVEGADRLVSAPGR